MATKNNFLSHLCLAYSHLAKTPQMFTPSESESYSFYCIQIQGSNRGGGAILFYDVPFYMPKNRMKNRISNINSPKTVTLTETNRVKSTVELLYSFVCSWGRSVARKVVCRWVGEQGGRVGAGVYAQGVSARRGGL